MGGEAAEALAALPLRAAAAALDWSLAGGVEAAADEEAAERGAEKEAARNLDALNDADPAPLTAAAGLLSASGAFNTVGADGVWTLALEPA